MIHRAILVAGVLFAGCKGEMPTEHAKLRPVRVMEVLSTESARTRTFAGSSQAGVSSVLSFKVAGTVTQVAVKVGDKVDKGQVIARLDPKDFELQVQEARAALLQAKAQKRNAKSSYERVRALYENQNASPTDLDGARMAFDTARAQVSSVSKRLELARRQLDYCVLRSPANGAIAAVNVDPNENVPQGQPVAMLTSGSKPEVQIEVPEVLIARIARGSRVKVAFDALPNRSFEGVVSEVGVAPVTGATTFPVTVRLEGATEGVRPGLAAEVEFQFEATGPKGRFLVPPFAVQADARGQFVFVAKPGATGAPGTVERREVTVGDLTTEGLEIEEGLEDGDLLVTAGVTQLTDGQQVKVPTPAKD